MKTCFIPVVCLVLVSCSSKKSDSSKTDTTIRIDLNAVYDAPGRGFTILYPVSKMEDSVCRKITFPDMSEISDTTYAHIYFTGKNHSAVDKGILVLIGNYASQSPLLWVDYNNDFNFSDARKPLKFSKRFMDVSVSDLENPERVHTIRFHKPDQEKKAEIKKMLEQYILKGETYADFFMDERRNILVGDFVYKQDSLRIGLMDWNVNGSYADLGTDRIVIGKYGGDISGTEESEGAVILDSITYFQGNSYAFEVTKVSANGKSISVKPTLPDNIKDHITRGDSIPDYSFKLFSGEETSVYHQLKDEKYVYLSFWATWCVGCRHEIDSLKKIHSAYANKVTIIGLNYNESAEKIKPFLDKYEINWLNGYSNEKINTELLINGLPRNILIDPSGKIVEMNIHPLELLKRITDL